MDLPALGLNLAVRFRQGLPAAEYLEPKVEPWEPPREIRYLTEMCPLPLLAFIAFFTGLTISSSSFQASNTFFDHSSSAIFGTMLALICTGGRSFRNGHDQAGGP